MKKTANPWPKLYHSGQKNLVLAIKLPLVAVLLLVGLLVGCAPAESQASQELVPARNKLEPTRTEPINRPKGEPTSLVTPPAAPTPTPSPTLVTPSPTLVKPIDTPALTSNSPLPAATPTDTPILTPVTDSPDSSEGVVIDGLQLYQQQNCGTCHQLDVAGTQGTLGPPHNGIATTADARLHSPDYTGTATTPAEYIRESIVNPGIYLVAGYNLPRQKMPAFTNLSEVEVEALVQFLLQQK